MHQGHRRCDVSLWAFVLTLAVVGATAGACIWDRDTLGIEARGLPGVAEIITGRFERQPPLFYEMRLARVTAELKASPHLLEHYDDAGVACDRLGRGDEAIAWMAAKKKQLDTMSESDVTHRDHLYRYHANLGTFYAHRWIRSGKDREKLDDMKKGRDLIAKAIEINPDAHFGRENYQLAFMEWIIELPAVDERVIASIDPQLLGRHDAVTGLTGLVALGDAWQSVDVFYALTGALQRRRHEHLAELTRLRLGELLKAGRTSLHPQGVDARYSTGRTGVEDREQIREYFERARAAADRWHDERMRFMQPRLEAGQHPDTHPGFWTGYVEAPAEPVPGAGLVVSTWARFIGWQGGLIAFFVFASGGAVLFKVMSDWRRRARRLRNSAPA